MTIRHLIWIAGGGLVARAALAVAFPVLPDEAYYWVWAHHLAWSYPDHPPMIAYLIALTTWGENGSFWVRLSPLVLGAATTYTLYLVGRDMFDEKAGIIAAALFQVVPILWLGGTAALPDAPLYLAWVATLRFVWQATHGQSRRGVAAGLTMGLGLLSKLYMAFLGVGLVCFVLLDARPGFRRKELFWGVLIAGLAFLPVIIWNLIHDWAGVHFFLYERPRWGHGLAGLRGLLSPHLEFVLLLFPAFVWALWAAWRRRGDERFRYLLWTTLPAIAFTVLTAFVGIGRGAWLGPVYLELAIILGALWNRGVAALAWGNAALTAVFIARAVIPGLPPPPIPIALHGWDQAAARVEAEVAAFGPGTEVITDNYEIASELSYHSGGTLPVLLVPRPAWALVWPPLDRFTGSKGVAVTYGPLKWSHCFSGAQAVPLTAENAGNVLTLLYVYRLTDLSVRRCLCDQCCPYCPYGITR